MFGFAPHPDVAICDAYGDGYRPRLEPGKGTLDPLCARAVAVADENGAVIVLAMDVLEIPPTLGAVMRSEIERRTGIPGSGVLINASHTHASPDWSSRYHDIGERIRDDMVNGAIEAGCQAFRALRPARFGYGKGKCKAVAINRRDVHGPIDPEVGVLRFDDEEGQPIAGIVKYACHPNILQGSNLLYSADYPGVVCSILERVCPGAVVAFLQGAAGNINPVAFPTVPKQELFLAAKTAVKAGGEEPTSVATRDAIGMTIAAEALRVFARLPLQGRGPVGAVRTEVELPLKSKDERERFCQFMTVPEALRGSFLNSESVTGEVQGLRIGPLRMLALPGEPFVEIGLRIRGERVEPALLVLGYSNGTIQYVPSDSEQGVEGYENVASIVAIGAQTRLDAAAHAVLDQL